MAETPRTALIVGASRGLGLGLVREHLARGWRVIATVRGEAGRQALAALPDADRLVVETLDIGHPEQITALRERLATERLSLLFVNAGVANEASATVGEVTTDEFVRVMATNALAPLRVIERFESLVPEPDGVIAAMSSILGSVGGNDSGGYEVYRASKAALNTLLRSFAVRTRNRKRTVLAVHPGWVRTDMGGAQAPLDVETSVRGMADTLEKRRGSGGVAFVDYRNETMPW